MKKQCSRCGNKEIKGVNYCNICGLKIKEAPEVLAQEHYTGKCKYCNKINEVSLSAKIHNMPKYCMECGETIIYQRNPVL
ncbi:MULTISPECIES: hypothetical protein [Clostridium]|uniref:DZANK-type domain-containing protein n=1 Tax=Clostridium haemolyticum NCTC 9693 TaxID=1443114 RepID=A0ABR4TD03_CLOHA|nr:MULTISPECIES: hypothetical protein [Clostridium]KEH93251.1 hypothetical protein Z963_02630 [Clostridium botulinum C/D str. It1]KEI15784.1 hypothetical protein Z960_11625 [Clostridium haemolyticum NCTC 9693]